MDELSLDNYIEDRDNHLDNQVDKDIDLGYSRRSIYIRASSLGSDSQENTLQKDW